MVVLQSWNLLHILTGKPLGHQPPAANELTFAGQGSLITAGCPSPNHDELSSLKTFAQKTGLELDEGMARLRQAGYPVEDSASPLQSIADRYGVSPQQLYDVMKPAASVRGTVPHAGKASMAS